MYFPFSMAFIWQQNLTSCLRCRRGSSRRHGRRCTEHVHFHYASDSAQPVQGVPVPEEAQAAAQTTRLHSI